MILIGGIGIGAIGYYIFLVIIGFVVIIIFKFFSKFVFSGMGFKGFFVFGCCCFFLIVIVIGLGMIVGIL